ncbi:unnamed protein product [Hanseniaspora opuntiae]
MSGTEAVIVELLNKSLNPQFAKSIQSKLDEIELVTPNYGIILLTLLQNANVSNDIKLAAAINFKNLVKRKWIDIEGRHLLQDVQEIRSNIIDCMIQLPNILKSQIGEAISIIAESDFPEFWPNLINELVTKLSLTDFEKNIGVLTVAHEVFKRWRHLARSDELFLEILKVLGEFQEVFMKLFLEVDQQIQSHPNDAPLLNVLFENFNLLLEIYYDLNCQDIPEFFEENIQQGFSVILRYLTYKNSLLEPEEQFDEDEDDSEVTILIKTKCNIQELLKLYASKYGDVFGPLIGTFVETTWELLTTIKPLSKNDLLVCNSMEFLSSVAKINEYSSIFSNENGHLNLLLEKIILPNLMLHSSDIEMFEDDPIEFVRRDLEGSDIDTRRRSCTDFLKVLKSKNLVELTEISMQLIANFLNLYKQNPKVNWKYKDLAIYFYVAVAVEGQITTFGCMETNPHVNVIEFFQENIANDLSTVDDSINPIILVDAIKYIYVFRNQIGKDNIKSVLPYLATFLTNNNYVVYTYSAVTLERVLSMRESRSSSKFVFQKGDLVGASEPLITNLFKLIMKDSSKPEKLAENEFLMKSIYKICSIAQDTLGEFSLEVIKQSLNILDLIKSNPSNPRFTHFTFESVAVNVKTQISINIGNIEKVVSLVMPSILNYLADDVTEFLQYSFQLLAYLTESSSNKIPVSEQISQLSQPLLAPTVWEMAGNIPATTRFLVALLNKQPQLFSNVEQILGLTQKLLNSKKLFVHAFEILEALIINYDPQMLSQYLPSILSMILARLQNKDLSFSKRFILFVAEVILGKTKEPNFVVDWFSMLQQDTIFTGVFNNVIISNIDQFNNLLEKKVVYLGLLTFGLNSNLLLEKYPDVCRSLIDCSINMIKKQTQGINSGSSAGGSFLDMDMVEEISTFGSSYSKLISISKNLVNDPLPYVSLDQNNNNLGQFVQQELLQPKVDLLNALNISM